MMEARCGHLEEKIFADVHHGLCRKCHSSFAFLLELEEKYGEDALIRVLVFQDTYLLIIGKKRTGCRLPFRPFDRVLSREFN